MLVVDTRRSLSQLLLEGLYYGRGSDPDRIIQLGLKPTSTAQRDLIKTQRRQSKRGHMEITVKSGGGGGGRTREQHAISPSSGEPRSPTTSPATEEQRNGTTPANEHGNERIGNQWGWGSGLKMGYQEGYIYLYKYAKRPGAPKENYHQDRR